MNSQTIIADLVHHLLNEIGRDPSVAPKFERLPSARDVWNSLLFCVLSSQVRAETAARAVKSISQEIAFFEYRLSSVDVFTKAGEILRSENVRYRFPENGAKHIANSWFAFAQVKDEFYEYLDSFHCEKSARLAVTQRFPGLGLKQASMFLRDIGYSDRLCVIDTHILWYCERSSFPVRGSLTPKRYFEIEDYLLQTADALGISANNFDSAVWAAVKTFKSKQCMMQFA